jgi:HAD superfamily hydrolase (TIGR01509 family)
VRWPGSFSRLLDGGRWWIFWQEMISNIEIGALVLDFDGLVLDTESCVYEAWRRTYEGFGCELPLDRWCGAIGSDGRSFDPLEELRALVGERLDVEEMQRHRRMYRDSLLEQLEPMPGVTSYLCEARTQGLGVGVASSSPRPWVEAHLERLELRQYFDTLATEEDVEAVKPAPDLYICATDALGIERCKAIAIEDSPNGVAAAKAAGLWCIAVPGPMTRHLSFETADRVLSLLSDQTLSEVIEDLAVRLGSAV